MPQFHNTMFIDKPVLIILEGPDGTGKSTLANAIVTAPGVKYPPYLRKKHGHTLSNEDLMRVTLELMTPQGFFLAEKISPTNLVVCDRYEPISDPIYKSVLYESILDGEHSPFSTDHLNLWMNALDQSWCVLIVACQGFEGEPPRRPSGKETGAYFERVLENYDAIVRTYNRLHAPKNVALWHYDYSNSTKVEFFVYDLCASIGPLCQRKTYHHICEKLGVPESDRRHFRWK